MGEIIKHLYVLFKLGHKFLKAVNDNRKKAYQKSDQVIYPSCFGIPFFPVDSFGFSFDHRCDRGACSPFGVRG